MYLNKDQKEYYHLLCLREIFDEFKPNAIKCEIPDWIIIDSKIGLECTSSYCKNEAYTFNHFNKYLGYKINDIPKKELTDFKGKIISLDKIHVDAINPIDGAREYSEYITEIGRSVAQKIIKLNKHYKECNKYYLSILSLNGIENSDLNLLKKEIDNRNTGNKTFNKVFVIAHEKIAVYEKNKDIKIYKVSEKRIIELQKIYTTVKIVDGDIY